MPNENKITKTKINTYSSIPARRLRAHRRNHILYSRSSGMKCTVMGI